MKPLNESKRVLGEGGISPMKEEIINVYMRRIKNWKLVNNKIIKEYTFYNDEKALEFVAKTGKLSIKEGHHPLATWAYNKVKITFHTHSIGGLSRNDFIMAAKFDEVFDSM